MKVFGRMLILQLLALAMSAATVRSQATDPDRPAVAYAVDGVLYLATESGRELSAPLSLPHL